LHLQRRQQDKTTAGTSAAMQHALLTQPCSTQLLTRMGTTCSTGKVVRDSSVDMDRCSHRSVRAVSCELSSSDLSPVRMVCSTRCSTWGERQYGRGVRAGNGPWLQMHHGQGCKQHASTTPRCSAGPHCAGTTNTNTCVAAVKAPVTRPHTLILWPLTLIGSMSSKLAPSLRRSPCKALQEQKQHTGSSSTGSGWP
jgi:hypothetical protein